MMMFQKLLQIDVPYWRKLKLKLQKNDHKNTLQQLQKRLNNLAF